MTRTEAAKLNSTTHSIKLATVFHNVAIYEATCTCGWYWGTATERGRTTAHRAHLRKVAKARREA